MESRPIEQIDDCDEMVLKPQQPKMKLLGLNKPKKTVKIASKSITFIEDEIDQKKVSHATDNNRQNNGLAQE